MCDMGGRAKNRAMISRSSHCVKICWMRRRGYDRANKQKRSELDDGWFGQEADEGFESEWWPPSALRADEEAEEDADRRALVPSPPPARAAARPRRGK